jgi:hypothetical protein
LRRIKVTTCDGIPEFAGDDLRAQFTLPENLDEELPSGIVIDKEQPNEYAVLRIHRSECLLNRIGALANRYDLAKLGSEWAAALMPSD